MEQSELAQTDGRILYAAGHRIEIHADRVLVDGIVKPLTPAELATLRTLAHVPGTVVGRDQLLKALPGSGNNTHAVETAMLRLRTALGNKNIVTTVVKRGYRLTVDRHPGGP